MCDTPITRTYKLSFSFFLFLEDFLFPDLPCLLARIRASMFPFYVSNETETLACPRVFCCVVVAVSELILMYSYVVRPFSKSRRVWSVSYTHTSLFVSSLVGGSDPSADRLVSKYVDYTRAINRRFPALSVFAVSCSRQETCATCTLQQRRRPFQGSCPKTKSSVVWW